MVKLRRVFESELYLESKKDLDDLKSFLGDKLFDEYMKIRDRISKDQNEFKDFSKLKKMDKEDIQDFVSSFQSKSDKKKSDKTEGAEKLYEDEDWVVYKITTYPAAKYYGSNTTWCITGRYKGHEERGEYYFNDYIKGNNLDGGYYFYISKHDPKEKYCILQTKDKRIHSIWSAENTDMGSSMLSADIDLPEVEEVNLKRPTDNELLLDSCYVGKDPKKVRNCLLRGANPNIKDEYGDTPLILTINVDNLSSKRLNIVKHLLKYGADPNLINDDGDSPLYIAYMKKHDTVVDLLLEHGSDPNIKFLNGNSILGSEVLKGNKDMVELFLKYGADPNISIKDFTGKTQTLIEKATERGYGEIVDLLKKYGAKE